MSRFLGALSLAAAGVLAAMPVAAHAQDTTYRGIFLGGTYDPLRDKVGIAVLPVPGAFGDSVRAIIQRDLDFSDRFTVIPVDSADPAAINSPGAAGGLNYSIFARLAASAIVKITPVGNALHVALHDVSKAQVVNVHDFALPATGLSRDWRQAVHRTSDEIERWITGQAGIAATRVAYMRGQSIRVVDSDGASEITVPTEENGVSPSWNPSGTMLAYTTYGTDSRLIVIDLSTGRSRTVSGPSRNTIFITPVFTPDGTQLVYSRSGEDQADLYITGVSGGDAAHRLTPGRGAQNTNPTLSPDGRRIVYVSNVLGRPELYIMDADGTNAEVLTNYEDSEKNYRSDPDWAPDGRWIAYQERIKDRFQIRAIRAAGGTPKLFTSEGENEQPSWAPDARHLVFTSTRTGVRQLWVLDTESNRVRQLTKSGGSRLASWSPRLAAQQ
ncbi:MAG: WD40-like beta Propeller containing protein [Gemmatimonadetes bacterium]|nr:WD40-like beta Propeller containing protein [Gemmatimonadota bacterium]